MVNEINVILAGVAAAIVSGVAGLLITWFAMRRALLSENDLAFAEHRSAELTRNLLVLEMARDQIESPAVDIAVRARLTPAEMSQASRELIDADLLEEPSPNLLRPTDAGRRVLGEHLLERELEETVVRRQPRLSQRGQSSQELDSAIEATVESLRARHAH